MSTDTEPTLEQQLADARRELAECRRLLHQWLMWHESSDIGRMVQASFKQAQAGTEET